MLGAGEVGDIAEAFIAAEAANAAASGLRALTPIDTPAKRNAALAIVGNAQDAAAALAWATAAGVDFENLDAEGRGNLLLYAIVGQDWDRALKLAERLSDEDLAAAPRTLHLAGMAQMAAVLAPDIREVLLADPPLQAAEIPLADTPEALAHRARARALFRRAAEAAGTLDCPKTARVANAFALWLGLRDPAHHAAALADLTALLRDGDQAIDYLPLALAFDVPVDRARIEQELARRDALEAGGTVERSLARFVMANTAGNPTEALAYLRRHRVAMAEHILPEVLVSLEIQLLVRTGQDAEAQARLDAIEDLPPAHRTRLQAEIGLGTIGPSIESLESWYAEAPTTFHLKALVERLARNGFSEKWFDLARQLVTTTGTLVDAEAVVEFMANQGRTAEIAMILEDVAALVPSSARLRAALAWSRYRDGDVHEADRLLQTLRLERDDRNDRNLLVNVLVSSGRWAELPPFIEREWLHRAARSPAELIDLARLANQIGSSRAAEFAKLAAEGAPADANVLVAAYTASSEAGVEDAETVGWIVRAHALSDENGPVTTGSLQEILGQADDWNRHTDDIWQKIKGAQLPLSLAATPLRRSSLELQLTPMLLNPAERDPRRRSVVPAFSGVRGEVAFDLAALALDGSAIVTLGVLGLLDAVVAKKVPIFIPHASLNWLFQERHRLRFHQPSRVRRAEALVRDLAAKRLWVFTPSVLPPPALINEVGRDLADMIAAALDNPGTAQRLVVRPAPVHKIGSLLSEGTDLTAYHSVLVSCSRIIDKLVDASVLTTAEADAARAHLDAQNEERWPEEPEITDGATLFLDDLSVSYLRTIKVLDRLHLAGLRAEISEQRVEEANTLVQLKEHAGHIEDQMEVIRDVLARSIASGAVRLDREPDGRDELDHPNLAVVKLASKVDVIVSDERPINKSRAILDGADQAAVWCSLDVIDWLRRDGDIDFERYLQLRTQLRRAGVLFIAPTGEELAALVERAPVKGGEVRESLEMRAVRENLQIAQMRGWLQLPDEFGFLQRLHNAIIEAILLQWEAGKSWDGAGARSAWLLNIVDQRDWASVPLGLEPGFLARYGHAHLINRLLLGGPPHAVRRHRDGLDAWLEAAVIRPLREIDADAFAWMINYLRDLVIRSENVEGEDDR